MMRLVLCFLFIQSCEKSSQPIQDIQSALLPNINVEKVVDSTPSFEQELIGLINDHRLEQGLAPLIKEDELSFIALKHSQNMAMNLASFGHFGFSLRCEESRLVMGGGNWCAENVAMGYETPKSVFNGWINSPGHRAIIENSKATITGIAYAISGQGTFYWTQIFLEF
jgi:uncharacterized protein YkwD